MKEKQCVADIPLLLKEWDYDNNSISPFEVSRGSAHICYWKCSICGFSYSTRAYSRGAQGTGCPKCAKQNRGNTKSKNTAKINNFADKFPKIAKEWHPTKNGDYTPKDFSVGSNFHAWWLCSTCGHEWKTTITHRTCSENNCPKCAIKIRSALKAQTHAKRNNFAQKHPKIAKEWHPTKNGGLKPNDVSVSSNKKVWWLCDYCGYEWPATVNHRTSGEGCPNCSKAQTSFAEQAVYYYVSQVFPDAIHRYKDSYEFDIFIPSKNIAIEYDGYYYHIANDRFENDNIKDEHCKNAGISLIRIRNPLLPNTKSATIIHCEDHKVKVAITKLLELIGAPCSIDIKKDTVKIQEQFKQIRIKNSLESKYLEISKEWHPWKNGKLKPSAITAFSSQKIWWLCSVCGHEWQDTPNHRCGRNSGCPVCAGKVIIPGKNDLATIYPNLAEEWHPTKNGDLKPTQVAIKSNKTVWWKCKAHGHEWPIEICARTRKDRPTNCPICGNKQVLTGFNDLATTHPHLANEWHETKNGDLRPTDIVAGSHKKVWWLCKDCGHEWEAFVYSRKKGNGCPKCALKKQANTRKNNKKAPE